MRARDRLAALSLLAILASPACGGRSAPAASPPSAPAKTELTSAAAPAQKAATGLFRYVADEATFEDCTTGKSYPVMMEAEYLSTQYAYTSAAGRAPGAPMLIKAFVHVVENPHVGDPERHQMIVIDRLVEASNDTSTCQAAQTGPSSLAASRWRLVELDGAPAPSPAPTIAFDERDLSVSGATGCNDVHGSWTRPETAADHGRLELEGVVATPKACTPTEADVAFVRALEATRRFEIAGGSLRLFDDASRLRARFEVAR